jgi:hypothetical protein
MLAFSGCYYGGGEKEVIELGRIRKRWKTLHVRSFKRVVSLYKMGLVADDNQDMMNQLLHFTHALVALDGNFKASI